MYINPESLQTAAKGMAAATDLRKNKNIGASNDMLCFGFMQQALYRINFSSEGNKMLDLKKIVV